MYNAHAITKYPVMFLVKQMFPPGEKPSMKRLTNNDLFVYFMTSNTWLLALAKSRVSMDKDIDIMFCVESHNDLLPQSRASVVLDQAYYRKKSDRFEKQILSTWETRKRENPTLFNGTKFRLHRVEYASGQIKFYLGVTCYRDFIGTNWSPAAKELSELGVKEFGDSQAYMSDAMGVGALVLTRDGNVIFMKRSMYCGEAKGLWDIPGGHAEPQEIVGKIPVEDIDISKLDPSQVVSEIYDSIVREVVDEVNIPRSFLSEPEFIGVARNKTSAGRPSVEFLIRCSLSSEEVKNMYHQGNQEEAYETTNISLQQLDSVMNMDDSDIFWQTMAPSAKGCMILYKLHKTDQLTSVSGNS